MNQELEKYIDMAVADGEVTEKEKTVLLRKAKELGVDQDELDMILEAKLHLQKKSSEKPKNEPSISATKECPSCGAQNDVIFTNCMFCKTALPNVDINAISNDELVLKASEWVGKLDGIDKTHGLKINLESSTGLNKFFGERDYKYIAYSEVVGFAEKYLSLLEIRSHNNETLKIAVGGLRQRFNHNSIDATKRKKRFWLIYAIVSIALFGVIFIGVSGESSKEKELYAKLDFIEQKIESAILEKNYDFALTQVEKLYWTFNPTSHDEEVKQYEKKRENYKKLIMKLMKDAENADN